MQTETMEAAVTGTGIESGIAGMRVGAYCVSYAKTPFTFFDSTELSLCHEDGTYALVEFFGPSKASIAAESGFTTETGEPQPNPAPGGPKQVAHSRIIYHTGTGGGRLVTHWSANG